MPHPPPGISVSRTRRAASSPDSSGAIIQQKSRAVPRASLRASLRAVARVSLSIMITGLQTRLR